MRCVHWVVRSVVLGSALTVAPLAAAQPKAAVASAAPKGSVAKVVPKAAVALATHKAAAPASRVEAGGHYDKGSAAQKSEDWQLAYSEYAKAYSLYQNPQILVSLGRAELKVGKHRDAAEHLTAFLADPPALHDAERAIYEADLAEAKKHVASLEIHTSAGAALRVDGREAGTVPASGNLAVFVEPGKHEVEARLGQALGVLAISVKEGESPGLTVLPVEPPKAPLPEPPSVAVPAAPPPKTIPPQQSTPVVARPMAAPVDGSAARRSALIKGGAALTGLGIGIGVGTAIAAAVVGADAGGLRNAIARAGGESACSGRLASAGRSCAELLDLTNRQSALSNTAVWSFVGAAGVGLATAAYAFGTRDKVPPAKGMIVAPVVGEATGGLAVTGVW